jgi:hypothetical protein
MTIPKPDLYRNNEVSIFRIVRAPRPLVLLRVFRNFFKFQLPKNRINQIFK